MTDKEIAEKMIVELADDKRVSKRGYDGLSARWFKQVMHFSSAQCRAGRLASDGRIVYVDGRYRLSDDDAGEGQS